MTRREWGISTAAALGAAACATTPPAQETAPAAPSGPLYLDLHIDTPGRMFREGLDIGESKWYHSVDIEKMHAGGLAAGFFAVFSSARGNTPLESVKNALTITDVIVEEVSKHPDHLFLATTADDVLRAHREGKIGIMLGVEGGHMIDSSMEVLRQFYRLGARYLGLTHSGNTPWVGAAEYKDGPDGLTDFGKEIVREMNRLGMMIDMSHASDQSFYDVIDTSTSPIINTHACCRAVANHPRNLTDDMLKKLGENGGTLGVAYYAAMLDDEFRAKTPELRKFNDQKAMASKQFADDPKKLSEELWKIEKESVESIGAIPITRLVDHIEHCATVAGIDHVSLGCDYDSVGLKLPKGLEDISKTPNLIVALEERGFSDEDVDKIMGRNALRVLQENEKNAG